MNIHRWRKLQGSDPAAYEMIQKIQALQKRLIVKTEQVVEQELVIQEKEKSLSDLEKAVERHALGKEAAQQLSQYKQTLKEKNQQLKVNISQPSLS